MSTKKIEYLASEYGVKRIGLFGSHAKGTSIESTSEVDIVVEFDGPIGFKFMELADYLEKSWENQWICLPKVRYKEFDIPESSNQSESL